MTPAAAWLIAGLLLCGAELLAPGVYLLWLGIAACLVGLALLAAPLPFAVQVGSFAALAIVAVLAGRVMQRRHRIADPNAPGTDLVGQQCRALGFDGVEGRVRFRDGEWPARADGTVLPGDVLTIVAVEGTRLIVRRAVLHTGH